MKFLCAIILAVAFAADANATSREQIAGATQVEREIKWTWKYLKDIADSCLASTTHCKDAEVRSVVVNLSAYLPAYESTEIEKWGKLLNFIPEKDGVFTSDGGEAHRLAITGYTKFSPVQINSDRMNVALKSWVGILAHEATHHLGIKDDENRIPDRVGAELAAHFDKSIVVSSLTAFNRQDAYLLIMNLQSPRLSLAMFSTNEDTIDLETGSSPTMMICPMGETPTRQVLNNPTWFVNHMKKSNGRVRIKAGGYVGVYCKRANGTVYPVQHPLEAAMDLQYSSPLKMDTWQSETPKVVLTDAVFGASNQPYDVIWGTNRTFVVSSMTHEKKVLSAGDTWKVSTKVTSLDGAVPQTCVAYFTAANWALWKQVSMSAFEQMQTCTVVKTGANQYQVDASFKMPMNMQSDEFYIDTIQFPTPTGDRFAKPHMPDFVHVKGVTTPRAVVESMKILGLQSASTYHGDAVTNSFKHTPNKTFKVEFTLKGDQTFSEVGFDLDMHGRQGGMDVPFFVNGPVADFPQFYKSASITKIPGGSKIVVEVFMPQNFMGFEIMMMKISRMMVRTSDFSWAEIENLDKLSELVVNENHL